jgi:hypothetical protein
VSSGLYVETAVFGHHAVWQYNAEHALYIRRVAVVVKFVMVVVVVVVVIDY